jgi:heme-degrading monooxygenase HmoA
MTQRARVLVFAKAEQNEQQAIAAAYHEISEHLKNTPGLLSNELLHSTSDPSNYVVMSEWESLEAFQVWEAGPVHRNATAPLRKYLTGATFYQVTSAY